MRCPGRLLAASALFLLAFASPARSQHIFLDTNGDGVNDASDVIRSDAPTTIDIWIDTSKNRDGSPTACDVDPSTPLTINSWEIVLHAVGGTLQWGPLDNLLPISPHPVCFAALTDTTDPVTYHNGWGGYYILPPGLYHAARLKAQVKSGDPAIVILPFDPVQPTDLTEFGTQCSGPDMDNTYKLGVDWFDADGIGKLAADPGGPYRGAPGQAITFDASGTLNPSNRPLTYTWAFGDGGTATGSAPTHAYAAEGTFTVTVTVSDGQASDQGATTATILAPKAPIARAGGPYKGNVGTPILFDGRGSSDPNGDALSYGWDFGDGSVLGGDYAFHTYAQARSYTVKLTVSDGALTSADVTAANIDPRLEHPPVAVAGGPYSGSVGAGVRFDGSGSSDPDNDPLTYHWIFGDGYESALTYPVHPYAAEGQYEVDLDVSDGQLTASDVAFATIGPAIGHAPTVSIGGPYSGGVRHAILFDARGSSDPDGDPLTWVWAFGDGQYGNGVYVSHVFRSAGTYPIGLTVSDGVHSVSASTVAVVQGEAPARAFLAGRTDLALGSSDRYVTLQIEPTDRSFALSDVDVGSITLHRAGSPDGTTEIHAVVPARVISDTDGNGIDEVAAAFRRDDLARLLADLDRPTPMTLELNGDLWAGGSMTAELACSVIPATGRFAAVVHPNPFNPLATVSFVTVKDGMVSAHLFNASGRLVRTVLENEAMVAGHHDLSLEARSDGGVVLPSGIYFLKIDSPDGSVTSRIAVAK